MVKGIKRTRPSCAVARMVPETHMQDSFFLSMIDWACGTSEYVRNLTAFKVPSFLEDHSETRSRRKFGLGKAVRKGDKANVRGRKAVESVAERSETQNSRVTGNIEELNAMFDSFDNFELEIENYNPRSQSNIDKG
ncbi:hypothetical protein AB6A40_008680 [Gnathostoma spinigerum]|uniref:Uncharacterized protein n=1 Tax=Gnathostoma spinigerum TaxID=75299 RepID=A0ABD6EWV0_9BILA